MALTACAALGHPCRPEWLAAFEAETLVRLKRPAGHNVCGVSAEDRLGTAKGSSLPQGVMRGAAVGFSPSELVDVLHAVAILGFIPSPEWLDAFARASAALMDSTAAAAYGALDSRELCSLMWAAGRIQEGIAAAAGNGPNPKAMENSSVHEGCESRPRPSGWPPREWVLASMATAETSMPSMGHENLCSLIWAVSKLTVAPRGGLGSSKGSSSGGGTPSKGENTSAGSSAQDEGSPPLRPSRSWMAAFTEAASRSLLPTTSIDAQSDPSHEIIIYEDRILTQSDESFTSQSSASPDPKSDTVINSYGPQQQQTAGTAPSARALCNMLHALVELQYRPSSDWLDEQLGVILIPHLSGSGSTSGSRSGSTRPPIPMVDVVSLLCSCARLSHRPQRASARVLLDGAYLGLPSATPAQAVELAWALGRLGLVPPGGWMQRCATSRVPLSCELKGLIPVPDERLINNAA